MNWTLPRVLDASSLAVETRGLTRRFGPVTAVEDLHLMVPDGAVYLLVGPNGSGKTTTFRMILGLLRPTRGEARVGETVSGPDGRVRASIGYVAETTETGYGWLRAGDLIDLHAGYYRCWDPDYQRRLERLLDIPRERRFDALSKGQARRVQLVLALSHRPDVLLLDEPTDGLDPVARDRVLAALTDHLGETPTTVLVATHLIYELDQLADHFGMLQDGRLRAQMERHRFQERLKRYVFDVPEGWEGLTGLGVIDRSGAPTRERQWVIWGEETRVRSRLSESGAAVRDVKPLSLEQAAVTLLGASDRAEP